MKLYLQLLEVFTVREIKSRYKASLLGPLWIIIHPLAYSIILSLIFGMFIKVKTEGITYFLFVLSGLIFWNFFQQGLELARDSLVWNRELVTKSAFPKSTLPISYILSKIPDFFVYFFIFLFFYLINKHPLNYLILLVSLTIVPLFLFSSGIALIVALAHSIFRDFGRIVEFFLMILFYATPIVYPESFVPEKYKIIIFLNPISLLIVFSRQLLFENKLRFDLFFLSLIISSFVFVSGILVFKKFGKKIADLI